MIPFAEWSPDSPDLGNTATEALGVIPESDGYRPFKALATISNALTARCQGAAWFRAPDGSTKNFAGDATKLYLLSSATWSDVSRAVGGAYGIGATNNWRYAQYGYTAYTTDGVDALQSFDLAAGTKWVAAAGSPPVCNYIGTVRQFLVLANISSFPQRVNWSGENNPATFASSATTLADVRDMVDGGQINGFVGGEFGLVFQEEAIQRMTFIGSPAVFEFDKIAQNIGATIPNTVAAWGDRAFFCHRSGFHMVVGGQQIVPIGRKQNGSTRVDRWFWGRLDQSSFHRVTCAIDPINSLYIVSFPGQSSSSGTPNEVLVYNWKADRWARGLVTCEMVYAGATQQGYTLEQLDAFGTLETLPYSLDSSYWTGSLQLLLSGFYTDHKYGTFSGGSVAASVTTQEVQPAQGKRCRVRGVRPITDGSPTLQLGYRSTQQAMVSWTSARSPATNGQVPFNVDSRYFRAQENHVAGDTWQWMQGIDDIDARPSGSR